MADRVLLVDDEPNVLQALRRQLRGEFQIETAEGGEAALAIVGAQPTFAVVVSDMQMPSMNGVAFLSAVAQLSPDSVRVMLTGNADQGTAVAAVNAGRIFRFVNKPCPADVLATTIRAACEQHRALVAEKELVQKTLSGSVKVLTDVLALANPVAFARTTRLRPLVRAVAQAIDARPLWECELTAMLGHAGCVAVAQGTLTKAFAGEDLSPSEQAAYHEHPRLGRDLIRNIARLEGVAEAVGRQLDAHDETAPIAARILKGVGDYDVLRQSGSPHWEAIARMNARAGEYDPAVLASLEAVASSEPARDLVEMRLKDLRPGMILAEPVVAEDGSILVGKGQTVVESMRLRLTSFARARGVREPIHALVERTRSVEANSTVEPNESVRRTAPQLAGATK